MDEPGGGNILAWRGVPGNAVDATWLVSMMVLLWGTCLFSLFLASVALARGNPSAWAVLAFGLVVFLPVSIGVTIWRWPSARKRLLIDLDRQNITFEHLRPLKGFWPERPIASYVCRFQDILGVEQESFGVTGQIMIHTPVGRFVLASETCGYSELGSALRMISPDLVGPVYQRMRFPAIVAIVVVLAVIAALFAVGVLP